MTLNVVPIIFNAISPGHDQENMDININIPLKWTIIIIIIYSLDSYNSFIPGSILSIESCNSMSNVF